MLLNLDETAIPRCAMKSRGYLTKKSSHVFRFLKKDLQRGIATHVAVVADNTRVQGMMPQFLLVNKRLFKESEVPADLGVPGLKVWQGDSAWNSWLIMRDILQEISFAAQTLENTQLILMLDACPCHLHGGVIGMANAGYLVTFCACAIDVPLATSGCLRVCCVQDCFDAVISFARKGWRAVSKSLDPIIGCIGQGVLARQEVVKSF